MGRRRASCDLCGSRSRSPVLAGAVREADHRLWPGGSRSRSPGCGWGGSQSRSPGSLRTSGALPAIGFANPFTLVMGKRKPSHDNLVCLATRFTFGGSVAVPMIVRAVHAIPGPHGRWAVPFADRQLSVYASPAREPARPSSATSRSGHASGRCLTQLTSFGARIVARWNHRFVYDVEPRCLRAP